MQTLDTNSHSVQDSLPDGLIKKLQEAAALQQSGAVNQTHIC